MEKKLLKILIDKLIKNNLLNNNNFQKKAKENNQQNLNNHCLTQLDKQKELI